MAHQWLLLTHQLPSRPSNPRVKIWRRLQDVGAVPTRKSAYVLPNTEQCREDFEWLSAEIASLGGEATVFLADAIKPEGSVRLVEAYRRLRADDYRRLTRDAQRALVVVRRGRRSARLRRGAVEPSVRKLRERFARIERIDFFGAAGRDEAQAALTALDHALAPLSDSTADSRPARLPVAGFQHRRWVTRPRPGVDRLSSA